MDTYPPSAYKRTQITSHSKVAASTLSNQQTVGDKSAHSPYAVRSARLHATVRPSKFQQRRVSTSYCSHSYRKLSFKDESSVKDNVDIKLSQEKSALTSAPVTAYVMEIEPSSEVMSHDRLYEHLNKVSRSFAFTIPMMGKPLQDCISLAYLLCRIVDTVEDDALASKVEKATWLSDFAFLAGDEFAEGDVLARLRVRALELCANGSSQDDLALVNEVELAINLLKTYSDEIQEVICHAVAILSHGMASSIRREIELADQSISSLDDVDNYCYFVAGVVGEMLAELFILFDRKADKRELMELAVSFGEGLQLTNILRDRAKDAKRGVSFLPPADSDSQADMILDYVALTQGHLDDAISFICTLSPKYSKGVRMFCLTNVAMAMVILRKIARRPLDPECNYGISRASAKRLVILCKMVVGSNLGIKALSMILSLGMRRTRRNTRQLRDKVSIWDHSSSTN